DEAVTVVKDMVHDDAIIVVGAVLDESMEDSVRVTVVATGIGGAEQVAFPSKENISSVKNPTSSSKQPAPRAGFKAAAPGKELGMNDPVDPKKSNIRPLRRTAKNLDDYNGGIEQSNNEDAFDIPTFLRRQMD
ncbi:MAG: hypothetical protein HQM00_12855, partial [Magnetococcales bacterium]|nr:hypothetical protein [Magnetococcales bacterium]